MFTGYFVVFDDMLTSSDVSFSREDLNQKLGQHDQLAIQCIVDRQDDEGGIQIVTQHSNDGRHWSNKYQGPGEVGETNNISASGTVSLTGYDDGTVPSFRFVRFKITLTGPCTTAHALITVTTRDGIRGRM